MEGGLTPGQCFDYGADFQTVEHSANKFTERFFRVREGVGERGVCTFGRFSGADDQLADCTDPVCGSPM